MLETFFKNIRPLNPSKTHCNVMTGSSMKISCLTEVAYHTEKFPYRKPFSKIRDFPISETLSPQKVLSFMLDYILNTPLNFANHGGISTKPVVI